jgi:hypothetical protein
MGAFSEHSMAIGVLAQAHASGCMGAARLMNPTETKAALKGRSGSDMSLSGWFLCGEVHPTMWALMKNHPDEVVLTANFVTTPSGTSFLMAHQCIGSWRHCVPVPLVGADVTAFTESLARGCPLHLSLANGNKDDALVIPLECSPLFIEHLSRSWRADIEDIGLFIEEMAMLAAGLMLRHIGSKEAEVKSVSHVCISPLITDELMNIIELSCMAGETASVH